VLGQV